MYKWGRLNHTVENLHNWRNLPPNKLIYITIFQPRLHYVMVCLHMMWSSKMRLNLQILILIKLNKTYNFLSFLLFSATLQLSISLELIDQFQWGLLYKIALQMMYKINYKNKNWIWSTSDSKEKCSFTLHTTLNYPPSPKYKSMILNPKMCGCAFIATPGNNASIVWEFGAPKSRVIRVLWG